MFLSAVMLKYLCLYIVIRGYAKFIYNCIVVDLTKNTKI